MKIILDIDVQGKNETRVMTIAVASKDTRSTGHGEIRFKANLAFIVFCCCRLLIIQFICHQAVTHTSTHNNQLYNLNEQLWSQLSYTAEPHDILVVLLHNV